MRVLYASVCWCDGVFEYETTGKKTLTKQSLAEAAQWQLELVCPARKDWSVFQSLQVLESPRTSQIRDTLN